MAAESLQPPKFAPFDLALEDLPTRRDRQKKFSIMKSIPELESWLTEPEELTRLPLAGTCPRCHYLKQDLHRCPRLRGTVGETFVCMGWAHCPTGAHERHKLDQLNHQTIREQIERLRKQEENRKTVKKKKEILERSFVRASENALKKEMSDGRQLDLSDGLKTLQEQEKRKLEATKDDSKLETESKEDINLAKKPKHEIEPAIIKGIKEALTTDPSCTNVSRRILSSITSNFAKQILEFAPEKGTKSSQKTIKKEVKNEPEATPSTPIASKPASSISSPSFFRKDLANQAVSLERQLAIVRSTQRRTESVISASMLLAQSRQLTQYLQNINPSPTTRTRSLSFGPDFTMLPRKLYVTDEIDINTDPWTPLPTQLLNALDSIETPSHRN